jgi:predicted phage terminase large subunit-like protein
MQLPKITTADRDLIEAELCRRSVLYFAQTFWPVLEPGRNLVTGWPIEAIAEHLEAVTRGEIRKLLITVPPGSMKSLLTRAFWPAWSWAKDPSLRYIGASYAEALAARDNRRAKMIVESPLYQRLFPSVRLSDDQAQKVNFANTATGSMMATSVRGRATGERGDVFCLPGDEVVWTENGRVPIRDVLINSRVWSFNRKTHVLELKRVTQVFRNPGGRIVRTTLKDGASVRTTDDHRFPLLNGGDCPASALTARHSLPSAVVVREPNALGQFPVVNPGSNCGNICFTAPELLSGHFGGEVVALANVDHLGRGQFSGHSGVKRAMPLHVGDVFGPRPICNVADVVVEGVPVKVPDIMPFWARPDKSRSDRTMGPDHHPFVGRSERPCAAQVSSAIQGKAEQFAPDCVVAAARSPSGARKAADEACFGDFVKPLHAGDTTPLSVLHIGHADETFCLTVADNNNFIAGSGCIVSNCIDDPHNVLEAESEAIRGETLQWFREVVPSRVNDLDRSAFVTIMQRVHHEDVAAAALEQGYEHLLIPMHYDPPRARTTSIGWQDPRTQPNELMWPARFSAQAVAELVQTLGPYASAAQLEQRPTPREGGLFKVDKLQTIDAVPDEEINWCRAWDLAATDGGGAYTAGVLVGWRVEARRVIIADVRRARLGPDGVRKMVADAADFDGDDVPISLPQDPGQAGKAQARDFVVRLAGYRVRIEPQSGSKETRAEPLAAQVEAGNVDIVTGAWNRDFIEELRHFPRSVYKDQADAASSGFNAVAPKRKRTTGLFVIGDHVGNKARPV